MNYHNGFQQIRKNALNVRSLSVDESLFRNLDEISQNCKNLLDLKVGKLEIRTNPSGEVWSNQLSINEPLESVESDLEESDEEEDSFELNVKLISLNLPRLRRLQINSGLQLKRRPVAPPILHELTNLREFRMCPIMEGTRCDRTRDERNLRTLAQSSEELRSLDLRGCYLKIFSLGWLSTNKLESLHLYYQVPAASVLQRWSKTLKYLTLAKISTRYARYRSLGPRHPREELDACLILLGSGEDSQLLQFDLQESDFSAKHLQCLIRNSPRLTYLDTRYCKGLPERARLQCIDRLTVKSLIDLLETND